MTIRKPLVLGAVSMWAMANVAYAQQPQSYIRPEADPIYLLNSTTIINGLVADFVPSDIQGIEVYKLSMRTNDNTPLPWQASVGTTGVLIINSTRRVPTESLPQLGRRLKLPGPLQFAIDGHWLSAEATSKLRITPVAIAQLHIIHPTDTQSATVVDIWLKRMPKKEHPPGSIFIR
ncbi:hypothetical protein [Hymenobacter perfusus]|uniref:Uncharacterized protein n=1 Tax=Hymenobacter perfusus TaxID=1236770 RepID=A0A428K7L4_9BACT|nr:hypothetical protein [Hymenobacter perfusus]RSK42478.1 hypothetical protein EI293_16330 [Hymenobacter perfusus]